MIETVIMLASIVLLAYIFNASSRIFWAYRSEKGYKKWLYILVSIFVLATYFIFALVMFFFIAAIFDPSYYTNMINIVVGIFFLSGAALMGAIMKYHLIKTNDIEMKNIKNSIKIKMANRQNKALKAEIGKLEQELNEAKKLNKIAIDRELRIIELKKKIESMQEK